MRFTEFWQSKLRLAGYPASLRVRTRCTRGGKQETTGAQ
jgi:hypothetical protein